MKQWMPSVALVLAVCAPTLGGPPASESPATPYKCSIGCEIRITVPPLGASAENSFLGDLLMLFPDLTMCGGQAQPVAGEECCEAKGCPAQAQAAKANESKCAASGCCAAKSACCGASKASAAACCASCPECALYTELVAIIKETDSPDTFTAAVAGLMATEGHGKRAIPTVIRNAERLGVLKGLATVPEPTPAQALLQDYFDLCAGRSEDTSAPQTTAVPVPANVYMHPTVVPLPPVMPPPVGPAPRTQAVPPPYQAPVLRLPLRADETLRFKPLDGPAKPQPKD
jgi:hypothetical protein